MYKKMADFFLNQEFINSDSILIPAPQHTGYAIYTNKIAHLIAAETGARVEDIVRSKKRKTLYEMKKQNKNVLLPFFLADEVSDNSKDIYFVDNVMDTGKTLSTVETLIGRKMIPLVYGVVR